MLKYKEKNVSFHREKIILGVNNLLKCSLMFPDEFLYLFVVSQSPSNGPFVLCVQKG